MNQVTLIGRLTKVPELKYTQGGKAFCNFTIAVPREFNREETDFIGCVAWEKRAETIAEYIKKGQRVAIQGRLNVRNYEQNGEKKWITEVIVEKFEFIETSKESNFIGKKEEIDEDNADDFPF